MKATFAPLKQKRRGNLNVVVVHETNGRKYLEALVQLRLNGSLRALRFFEASVVWKFVHAMFRERRSFISASAQLIRNIAFRITVATSHNKTFVICLPPWDFRFIALSFLRRRNKLIYNTSWPHWTSTAVPRRGGLLGAFLEAKWRQVLTDPSILLTAVTPTAATALSAFANGRKVSVIPHVVSDVFFSHVATYRHPFRILFVGDLVENRGFRVLGKLLESLEAENVTLEIVGDGPLRALAKQYVDTYNATWHRGVSDRNRLAEIVASAQVLVSPSVRSKRWEELFGMAILEAMSCGVPCIASDHVGPRGLIDSGLNGFLVNEGDIEAMAQDICKLINDQALWSLMASNARAKAAQFRVKLVAEQWAIVLGLDGDNEL